MATNRILEFTPSQEEAIVARILVLLHQAVDDHFPAAEKATRQFTKTVFSDDSERTALGSPTTEGSGAHGFGSEEKTGPGERPPEGGVPVKTPPPPVPLAAPVTPPAVSAASSQSALTSDMTGLTGLKKRSSGQGTDWVTSAILVLLVAGLILLAYSFLA